ncbi:DUF429 domain-containing protein [Lichenifustis flavocetrariae]|uniref:DUF429 domain-containing protein n=1 Tax=Lichenifustis flavocetrariae TaxID=2949735 RepID=A0AA42CJU4_9HYPH|nr:DUF429 domain-containing protein [Lichenifustis flavocetrariae]MCW6509859.1 DUF429 domain-containing protein [Lichenifustis flavocetrariae]
MTAGSPATFIGFDSAWADNSKAPGAICSIHFDGSVFSGFLAPRLVGFAAALEFIRALPNRAGPTLLALDQPTIVPNATGMRPVEKVAATLVSWVGGGVQPANRGRRGMFDDGAPVWRFLSGLGAVEDPLAVRTAMTGLHLMEVFPALAFPSLADEFFGRLAGPRYNPGRRATFRLEHWQRVITVVMSEATRLGCHEADTWLANLRASDRPTKGDQDRLDALICMLVAVRWRLDEPDASAMIGDLTTGYIVTPTSAAARTRLAAAAYERRVPYTMTGAR